MSNFSYKSCTLLWYAKKETYLHEISVYFHKNVYISGLLNLGAQIKCTQNRYTTVQTDLKYPLDTLIRVMDSLTSADECQGSISTRTCTSRLNIKATSHFRKVSVSMIWWHNKMQKQLIMLQLRNWFNREPSPLSHLKITKPTFGMKTSKHTKSWMEDFLRVANEFYSLLTRVSRYPTFLGHVSRTKPISILF